MTKFLKAFRLLVNVVQSADKKDVYKEDPQLFQDDINYVVDIMKANMPRYPFFVDRELLESLASDVASEHQYDIAREWIKQEPELKYENEWSPKEALSYFEEYIVYQLAMKVSDELIRPVRDEIQKQVRDTYRKRVEFSDITEIYEYAKNTE